MSQVAAPTTTSFTDTGLNQWDKLFLCRDRREAAAEKAQIQLRNRPRLPGPPIAPTGLATHGFDSATVELV